MPAAPLYAHRLADGIEALGALSSEWVDRRTLEEALGIGRWTAWRLLKRCGAEEGPGASLVCRRQDLIEKLKALQTDAKLGPEIARRNRVERYLDSMIRYAGARHRQIARDQAAAEIVGSRFSKLPAGVDLQRRELRIEFHGTEDFLQKFGAVVFALHNDYDQVRDFIEAGRPGSY